MEKSLCRVAVLGLGCSINEFKPQEFDWSIGVNDIWRVFNSDDIVCLDKRSAFTPDRLKVIDSSKPKHFYSQIVQWDTRPDFVKIELKQGYPDRICNIDGISLNKSYCSPFVAVQVAYVFYRAAEIHLFGVDLVNHPHLDRQICAKIKLHFRNFNESLKAKGHKMIIHGNGILSDIR